jgi:hypothetical protein
VGSNISKAWEIFLRLPSVFGNQSLFSDKEIENRILSGDNVKKDAYSQYQASQLKYKHLKAGRNCLRGTTYETPYYRNKNRRIYPCLSSRQSSTAPKTGLFRTTNLVLYLDVHLFHAHIFGLNVWAAMV